MVSKVRQQLAAIENEIRIGNENGQRINAEMAAHNQKMLQLRGAHQALRELLSVEVPVEAPVESGPRIVHVEPGDEIECVRSDVSDVN